MLLKGVCNILKYKPIFNKILLSLHVNLSEIGNNL